MFVNPVLARFFSVRFGTSNGAPTVGVVVTQRCKLPLLQDGMFAITSRTQIIDEFLNGLLRVLCVRRLSKAFPAFNKCCSHFEDSITERVSTKKTLSIPLLIYTCFGLD